MKSSTLRNWLKTQTESITPDDRVHVPFRYMVKKDFVEAVENMAKGLDRRFSIDFTEASFDWKDGSQHRTRKPFYHNCTINVLYWAPENREDETEDRAVDDGKKICAQLKDPTNRLSATSEGEHAWTHCTVNGLTWAGTRAAVLEISVQIKHRRIWS